jgi:hypothetical protein
MKHLDGICIGLLWLLLAGGAAFGQAECNAWGGLRGIRIDGQLFSVATGVRAIPAGGEIVDRLAGDLGNVHFVHEGNKQICTGGLRIGERRGSGRPTTSPVSCTVAFEDAGEGSVDVDVDAKADAKVKLAGIYFFVHLRREDYSGGSVQLLDAANEADVARTLTATRPSDRNRYLSGLAKGLRAVSPSGQIEMTLDTARNISVEDDPRKAGADFDVYFPISMGPMSAGQTGHLRATFKVSGPIDKTPAKVVIDLSKLGSAFDGIGGNFRIQSDADAPQIQYNLDHLRTAWGRVALPWNLRPPSEKSDPTTRAVGGGKPDPSVRAAMEMARTLADRKIPMIISVWFPPEWAVTGPPGGAVRRGRRIDPKKWDAVCESIGSYLEYLKEHYGAEPRYFSFNESDIGIDVLQSPEEHEEAIKRLGSYFAAHRLVTKMLLGDTGDPTGIDFIKVAMSDPEAVKYIGAVSFHSWRGGTVEQFTRWGEAARKLGVPLIVAEGGTDSNSYAYPNIFLEPWYGLEEMSQYLEICAISQPASILQWQFTHDYSLLTGGTGGEPLKPTQRFWNLKQMNETPVGSNAVAIRSDKAAVVVCAFFDGANGVCTVHLVNNGATREVDISGLPVGVTEMHGYVTDFSRSMKELGPVSVNGGTARITLDSQSFVTLMSVR